MDLTQAFYCSNIELSRLYAGQHVWKTDDPRLTQQLRRTYESADPQRRVPLMLTVHAEPGRPLLVEGIAKNGACACRVESEAQLDIRSKTSDLQSMSCVNSSRLGQPLSSLI